MIKKIKISLVFLCLILATTGLLAQDPIKFNLPATDGGGSFIGDMLVADGKIFLYAADGISVYNEAGNNTFMGKVDFNEELGKFNPVFHNPSLAVPDQSAMTSTSIDSYHYLFAITPKAQLMIIRTDDLSINWTIDIEAEVDQNNEIKYLIDHLDSQSGRIILKYDNNNGHNRLYILVAGRDPDNNPSIGCFHSQRSIFAIYDVTFATNHEDAPLFTRLYSEVNESSYENYPYQINNFIINENNNNYYLIRLGHDAGSSANGIPHSIFEIREVGTTNSTIINLYNESVGGYHKMGKVLYINDFSPNLKKIVIFPYKYFQGDFTNPKFFVVNIKNGVYHSLQEFILPNKRIMDAVYLEDNDDLIVCYAPENDQMSSQQYNNTNIAIYNSVYNSLNQEYDFILSEYFDDDNSIKSSDLDINYAIKLTKLDGSNALISKKDGIDKLTLVTPTNEPPYYDYIEEHNAENNFFSEGINVGSNTYILNFAANGISKYNSGSVTTTPTSYPVYHIAANPDGTKQAYFNRLESFNTGFYYTTDGVNIKNINSDTEPNNDITAGIGDIVYNPFQDHFLVSQNNISEAKIKILLADDFHTPDPTQEITFIDLNNNTSGKQFATRMFVSPDGYLYIWSNMYNTTGSVPELFVYDASDYSKINSFQVSGLENEYDFDYSSYQANFSYNYHTKEVYTIISIQESKLMPYNTETSTIYNTDKADPDPDPPPGKLLILSTSTPTPIPLNNNPGKIIFPGTASNYLSSQYFGKVYITGDQLYEYDYIIGNMTSIFDSPKFENIDYNAKSDQIFAIKEESTLEFRKFEIWTIYYENEERQIVQYNTDNLNILHGQTACLFSNPFNGRTYVYKKIDAAKNGEEQVKLYSFDPSDEIPQWQSETLGMASYFPEYDHTFNLSQFYFHNYITPYINPYTNEILVPNGAHSSISKVEYTPNEQLILEPGVNWISFPRLEEQGGTSTVDEVLLDKIIPSDYINGSSIRHLIAPTQSLMIRNYYNYSWQNFTDGIQSKKGYKINLDYPPPTTELDGTIELQGTILSPYTTMQLYENKKNWVGYFIPEEQDVLEALKDYEGSIYDIKHQDYYCYWGDPTIIPYGAQPPTPEDRWNCDQLAHNIGYGDMLEIRPMTNIPDFKWNYSGNPPLVAIDESIEYYLYTETADYTPFIIELDSTENPLEMGAFVNDSCIGACALEPNDSTAIIRGYIGDNSGDSVVFEEYFGTKSSHNNRISEYYVLNEKYSIHEQRTIKTNENKHRYFISLKNKLAKDKGIKELMFKIFPNPARDEVSMVYNVEEESHVNISILDSFGRHISILFDNKQSPGNQIFNWNLHAKGQKLIPGIYIIKLNINDNVIIKKLVIN